MDINKQILKLASHSIAKTDIEKKSEYIHFGHQIDNYLAGKISSGQYLLIEPDARNLKLPKIENKEPLFITQGVLEKIKIDHSIDLESIKDLPEKLKNHPLALDSLQNEDTIIICLDMKDKENNNVITAIQIDKHKGVFQINEMASLYGKNDLGFLIKNTNKANLNIYTNERSDKWLIRQGLQLPKRNQPITTNSTTNSKEFITKEIKVPRYELQAMKVNSWSFNETYGVENCVYVAFVDRRYDHLNGEMADYPPDAATMDNLPAYPLNAYEHGDVKLFVNRTAGIDDRWDNSHIGDVYIDWKEIKKQCGDFKSKDKTLKEIGEILNSKYNETMFNVEVFDNKTKELTNYGGQFLSEFDDTFDEYKDELKEEFGFTDKDFDIAIEKMDKDYYSEDENTTDVYKDEYIANTTDNTLNSNNDISNNYKKTNNSGSSMGL
jgi:hypothetical protein